MNITNITTANMQLQEKLNIIRDRYQQRHCHGYSHSQYQHPIRTVVNIDSSRASAGGVGVVSNGYHKRKYSLNLGEYKYVTSTSTPTPPLAALASLASSSSSAAATATARAGSSTSTTTSAAASYQSQLKRYGTDIDIYSYYFYSLSLRIRIRTLISNSILSLRARIYLESGKFFFSLSFFIFIERKNFQSK
jgi:hypothetical protein